MSRRLLVPLALLVTALLVVAALASGGRPLGGGGIGSGPGTGFFDYTFTTVVIAGVLLTAIAIWGWATERPEVQHRRSPRSRYLQSMLFLLGCAAIAWAMSRNGFLHRVQQAAQNLPKQTTEPRSGAETGRTPADVRGARIRWDEVAIVLALLAGAGVAAYAAASRRRPRSLPSRRASQAAVSAALDTSLDDLRAEPDLRKAIIAAYARMERALALAGLPRRPAEAPLEYLERTLGELEASADAVRRLTDLFEWAKFSHHEPVADMRDEAIEALVAVRDELRAPAAEAAAA